MKKKIFPDGAKLSSQRLKCKMTQEQLAEASGLSKKSIQRAEKGEPVQIHTLEAIASALNVKYGDLLRGPANEEEIRLSNLMKGQDLVALFNSGPDLFQYSIREAGAVSTQPAYEAIQVVKGYFEAWSMMEPIEIGEAEKEFDEIISSLAKEGFILFGVNAKTKKGEQNIPFSVNLITVVIYSIGHPDIMVNPEKYSKQ